MTKEELLVKRFRTLAKGNKFLLLDTFLTVEDIYTDLYLFPCDDCPKNWSKMSKVDRCLYIIDNSEEAREWIKKIKVVES